jgi:hypothetical protein
MSGSMVKIRQKKLFYKCRQGELYDYGNEDFSDLEGEGMSIH